MSDPLGTLHSPHGEEAPHLCGAVSNHADGAGRQRVPHQDGSRRAALARAAPHHEGAESKADTIPKRPLVRWHGGKHRLRDWIIAHMPPHRQYLEPFGGGLSVLFGKPRCHGEVVSDLDDEIVNLWAMARDRGAELKRRLALTPFARAEFKLSYQPTQDPMERARRLVVRSFMGFGSNAHASQANGHRSTGFRSNSNRSSTTPAQDWANYPAALDAIIERLRGVVIENRDAFELIPQHDGINTLHYLDPPYVWAMRSPGNKYDVRYRMYRHEMSDADHARLLDLADAVDGMVLLSGYDCPLYSERLAHWRREQKETYADGARKRVETLWLNPAAASALDAVAAQASLFAEARP